MATMSIAVREFTMSDHTMVDELREAVGVDLGQVASDTMAPQASGAKAFLTSSGSFMFGAYVDHDVAGGIWGTAIRQPDGGLAVAAREFYVLSPFRRRGIGTLLVESAMAMARRGGAVSFEIRSSPTDGVRELCGSLGSTPVGATEFWMV